MIEPVIAGISVGLGLSFFFLYTRKMSWSKPIVRWVITGCLFAFGLVNLLSTENATSDERILYWDLCVPLLYYSFDRLFRHLSFRIYQRDFVLYLKNTFENHGGWGNKNPHVQPWHKVFSFGLIFIIVALILIGQLLFS